MATDYIYFDDSSKQYLVFANSKDWNEWINTGNRNLILFSYK